MDSTSAARAQSRSRVREVGWRPVVQLGQYDGEMGSGSVLRGRDLVALEARSGEKVFEADFRGLRAIADLPRVRRQLLVYRGYRYRGYRRQKTADGVEVLPVAALLRELEEQSLFP